MARPHEEDAGFTAYLASIQKYEPLEREEELRLARRWLRRKDRDAADQLVRANLRFVVKIAMQYRGYGLKVSDLVEEGNIGLCEAVRRFDPSRNLRFMTYAAYWIRAFVLAHVLKQWSMVGVGTGPLQSKLFFRMSRERARITTALGAESTPSAVEERLAEKFGTSVERIRDMTGRLESKDSSLDAGRVQGRRGDAARPARRRARRRAGRSLRAHAARRRSCATRVSGISRDAVDAREVHPGASPLVRRAGDARGDRTPLEPVARARAADRGSPQAQAPPRAPRVRAAAAPRLIYDGGVKSAVEFFRKRFAAAGKPERATYERAYMKSALRFHGVDAAAIRGACADFVKAHALDHDALVGVVDALYATDWFDLHSAAVGVLERKKKLVGVGDAEWLIGLVRKSACWAHVDWLATKIVPHALPARPRALLRAWARDDDFWVRRTALLAQLDALRAGGGDFALFARVGRADARRKGVLHSQSDRLDPTRYVEKAPRARPRFRPRARRAHERPHAARSHPPPPRADAPRPRGKQRLQSRSPNATVTIPAVRARSTASTTVA